MSRRWNPKSSGPAQAASVALAIMLAGCILPTAQDDPGTVSIKGTMPPKTVPPGVTLSLSFENRNVPDSAFTFQALVENQAASNLYTRGNCYTPWSWTLARGGEPIQRGPPTATCSPISWDDFPARSNQTWRAGWDGTVWNPDEDTPDPDDGDYEPAPPGNYVATVRFAFYREKNPDRYCCPDLVANDISFTHR